MNYKLHTLSSGLRVLVVPMPTLESITLTVWVKTGSRNEDKRIGGISHFLEHMVFKGSKKRPTAKQISEAVDSIGGEFNAGTSKDWTNFYIKAGKNNLETAFDVLSDMVLQPILDSAEIEREKGTIIEEIRMYEDTPMMHIGDVFEELAFAGSPLGRELAGTEKTVRAVKKEDFLRYRKSYYYPENMLVTISGGVSEKVALKFAKKYFGLFNRKNRAQKASPFKAKFLLRQNGPRFKLNNKKAEQAHLILGFIGEGRGYKGRFAQSLLAVVLGGGMSSRMFIEVRERRGLAYSIRTSMDRYQEVGYMGTYAGVDVAKVDEAITVMLEQHYGIANGQFPISDRELTKAKEFLKGHLALALEDTKDVSTYFGEQALFLNEILTPEEIGRKVDKVTLKEVLSEAKKLFTPARLNLAIIGPYKSEANFVQLLR